MYQKDPTFHYISTFHFNFILFTNNTQPHPLFCGSDLWSNWSLTLLKKIFKFFSSICIFVLPVNILHLLCSIVKYTKMLIIIIYFYWIKIYIAPPISFLRNPLFPLKTPFTRIKACKGTGLFAYPRQFWMFTT